MLNAPRLNFAFKPNSKTVASSGLAKREPASKLGTAMPAACSAATSSAVGVLKTPSYQEEALKPVETPP